MWTHSYSDLSLLIKLNTMIRFAPGQLVATNRGLSCHLRRYHDRPAHRYANKLMPKNKMEDGRGLLAWYSRMLDTHPIITKSVSSAFIGGSGDIVSQYIAAQNEKRPFAWDAVRTFRFGFLGLVLIGPVIHVWYGSVMRWFPGQSASAVIKRVALDQIFFSPMFLPTFLSGLWLLEGKDFNQVLLALKHTLPTAIVANWGLWVPAQIINFRFVPGKYQVLFSNFVGFVWNAYLSYTAHSDDQEHLVGKASKQMD
jgi:hypothetical protein